MVFDCTFWWVNYHVSREEYFQFDFVHKAKEERLEYVFDHEVSNEIQRFNRQEESIKLDDKSQFNNLFCDLLGRDFLRITQEDYTKFAAWVDKHAVFMKKPLDSWGAWNRKNLCKESTY